MVINETVRAVFTFDQGYIEVQEDLPSTDYELQFGRQFLDELIRRSNLAYLSWGEFFEVIWRFADPNNEGGLDKTMIANKLCHDMLWPLISATAIDVEPARFHVKRIMRS